MKKLICLVLMISMFAFLAAGCTSPTGSALAGALAKQGDWKTVDASSEIKFNIKYNNFPQEDLEAEMVRDMFSNIYVKVDQSVDLNNLQQKMLGKVQLNGITADFEAFAKGNDAWIKLPMLSKYFKMDLAKSSGFESEEKFLKYQKEMPLLINEFAKKYISNYKFKFDEIKDNGSVSVQTPNGIVKAKEIEITLNQLQFKDFLKYGIKELIGSADLRDLIVKTAKLLDEEGANEYDELDKDLQNNFKQAERGMDYGFDELFKFVEIKENGVVAKFYMDDTGNIIKQDLNLAIKISEPEDTYANKTDDSSESTKRQSVDITLNVSSAFSNINKNINIKYPNFDSSNTMMFQDYDNATFPPRQLLEEYKHSKKRDRLSVFYMYGYADIKGNSVNMYNTPPYVKNNIIYVPARHVANAVGAKIAVNGKAIKFSDGSRTLVIYTNSKKALLNGKVIANNYASEVKNGTAMVPLNLIAENFGAKVTRDQDDKVTVEMPKQK